MKNLAPVVLIALGVALVLICCSDQTVKPVCDTSPTARGTIYDCEARP
jgi:hypothetical protein